MEHLKYYYTLCAITSIFYLFLYDTLMMVTEVTKTCWWILIYDKQILLMCSYWFVT